MDSQTQSRSYWQDIYDKESLIVAELRNGTLIIPDCNGDRKPSLRQHEQLMLEAATQLENYSAA